MPANATHEDYDASLVRWQRCRTAVAGEDAVKAAAELYLPKLSDQTKEEFDSYLLRAQFFNASGRTLNSLCGLVFRIDPQVESPAGFDKVMADVTLAGQSFYDYEKELVKEVLTVGRCGTLVDWSETEARPYFVRYKAEQIINWRCSRIGDRMMLSLVALHEIVEDDAAEEQSAPVKEDAELPAAADSEFKPEMVEQIRVLRLAPNGDSVAYVVEVYRKVKDEGQKEKWELHSQAIPSRRGAPLKDIPFVFHGPNNSKPDVDQPPLDDLVSVNLSHYRSSADLEHGRHFTALPTAWASGFDPKARLSIGSTAAWVTDQLNAKAAFLEFTGQGLGALEKALEHKEQQMAVLGARMLTQEKRAAESGSALKIRQTGEGATLKTITTSLSESVSMALRLLVFFGSPKDLELSALDKVKVEFNTNYSEERLTAQDITALVAAWQAGALSKDSMLYNFKQADLINPARSPEEELSLIEKEDGQRAMPGAGAAA